MKIIMCDANGVDQVTKILPEGARVVDELEWIMENIIFYPICRLDNGIIQVNIDITGMPSA